MTNFSYKYTVRLIAFFAKGTPILEYKKVEINILRYFANCPSLVTILTTDHATY